MSGTNGQQRVTKTFPVFDCDAHVNDPDEIWSRYVEPEYRELVRRSYWKDEHQAVLNGRTPVIGGDRKSTRLNSSHITISYAVFCLKKKKQNNTATTNHTNPNTKPINTKNLNSLRVHTPTHNNTPATLYIIPPVSSSPAYQCTSHYS